MPDRRALDPGALGEDSRYALQGEAVPFLLGEYCAQWGEFPVELRTDQARVLWKEMVQSLGPTAQPRVEEAYATAMYSLIQEVAQVLRVHQQRVMRSRFLRYTSQYGRWSAWEKELDFLLHALITDPNCRGPVHAYLLQKWAESIDPLVWMNRSSVEKQVQAQDGAEVSFRWFHRSFGDAWVVSGALQPGQVPDLVSQVIRQSEQREADRLEILAENTDLASGGFLLGPSVLQWVWDVRKSVPSEEIQSQLVAQLRLRLPPGFRVLTWIWAGAPDATHSDDALQVWKLAFPVYYQSVGACEKNIGPYRVQWACEPAQVLFRSTEQNLWMSVLGPERARRH